ncbi:MAG: HD-GYP domain-containing protein [Thioalkalivibrio sp.]
MPIKKIPSESLQLGMYVSSLDRPWVETPFMFQGFELQDQDEIDELKRLTRHVYVIIPDEEIELSLVPERQTESAPTTRVTDSSDHPHTRPAQEEIKKVQSSHQAFTELFIELESLVRADKPLPVALFNEPVKSLVGSVSRNPDAFIWLTRLKKYDSFLYKDSLESAVWAVALGKRLGIVEQGLHELAIGCLLMDVGKLRLPTALLNKTGRLDHDEWDLMKTHVELGVALLEETGGYPDAVLSIVRSHHERLDGCGYPAGLEGDHIPLFAQIAGIVDQYVAVTSARPFADPISPSRAEEMLYKQRGILFDEMLVEYFIQTLTAYPTGSLVELSSGEVAIVKAQKSGHNLRPDVILLLGADKQPYGTYTLANLDDYSKDGKAVRILKTLATGEYGVGIEELSI